MDGNTEGLTDSEILTKAISKANDNLKKDGAKYRFTEGLYNVIADSLDKFSYYHLIFSHDFAKAFWSGIEILPETDKKKGGLAIDYAKVPKGKTPLEMLEIYRQTGQIIYKGENPLPYWQQHFQQMVLEENPIQYLAKFL